MKYNADGQTNTTQVNGLTYTGLLAADGSFNIVLNASGSYVGLFHPCGAYNAVITTNPSASFYNANGSVNVIANNFGGYSLVEPDGVAYNIPYSSGITKANTNNFRTAYLAGNGVPLAINGDSTMRGIDETASPYNFQLSTYAPNVILSNLLQAAGKNAGANNLFGCSQVTIADMVLRDSRFNFTGATVAGSVVVAGGSSFAMPAAGTLTFTPIQQVTEFDIWTYDDAATRTISWQIDGGAATNITTSGVSRAQNTTVSAGSLGTHTLTLNWVAGSNHILAIVGRNANAGRKEIACWNWAIPGSTTTSSINNTNSPQGGRLQAFTNYAPKLMLTEAGLINSWRNGISVATSTSDMTTYVTTAKAANCDVILLVPPYDNSSLGNTSQQNAYVDAMYSVAAAQNVGIIDIRKRWQSYANSVANGWQVASDAVHPTAAGYADMARAWLPAILYGIA